MATRTDIVEVLASLSLFADVTRPQLEATAHVFSEELFSEDERLVRKGLAGPNFFIVLEGEAAVRKGDEEIDRLARGDFFGEISVLLGEVPVADVVATTALRALILPGDRLRDFLLAHPAVMFRMLQAEARRLRDARL